MTSTPQAICLRVIVRNRTIFDGIPKIIGIESKVRRTSQNFGKFAAHTAHVSPAPRYAASVLCSRLCRESPVRYHTTIEEAWADAEERPCASGCEGTHILCTLAGWHQLPGAGAWLPGGNSSRLLPRFQAAIFSDRRVHSLAAELRECYPAPRLSKYEQRHMWPAPEPWRWPAPAELNRPHVDGVD